MHEITISPFKSQHMPKNEYYISLGIILSVWVMTAKMFAHYHFQKCNKYDNSGWIQSLKNLQTLDLTITKGSHAFIK